MARRLKMPARPATDGAITVARDVWKQMDEIAITVTTDNATSQIRMSEHNAWRLFGALSVILEIPLSASAAKAIKL